MLILVLNGDRMIPHWRAVFQPMQSQSSIQYLKTGYVPPHLCKTICSAYPKMVLPAQIRARTTGSGCLHGVRAHHQRSMHEPPRLKIASLRYSLAHAGVIDLARDLQVEKMRLKAVLTEGGSSQHSTFSNSLMQLLSSHGHTGQLSNICFLVLLHLSL